MRFAVLSLAAALSVLAAPASAQQAGLPGHTTDPAQLPKVFAVGIRAADMARAERFYRQAMGATGATKLTEREVSISFPSGVTINLVQAAPDAPKGGEGGAGFIFQTADIDGLTSRVVAAGGTLVRPPSDGKATAGIRVAFVRDPDGTRIEVIQFPVH